MTSIYTCEECGYQNENRRKFVLFQGEIMMCRLETACVQRKQEKNKMTNNQNDNTTQFYNGVAEALTEDAIKTRTQQRVAQTVNAKVLSRLEKGQPDKMVAREMGISESTVRTIKNNAARPIEELAVMDAVKRYPRPVNTTHEIPLEPWASTIFNDARESGTDLDFDEINRMVHKHTGVLLYDNKDALDKYYAIRDAREQNEEVDVIPRIQRHADGHLLVSFDSHDERLDVLERLRQNHARYGSVSVSDVRHYAELESDVEVGSGDYGWWTLDDVTLDSEGSQYVLVFPREVYLRDAEVAALNASRNPAKLIDVASLYPKEYLDTMDVNNLIDPENKTSLKALLTSSTVTDFINLSATERAEYLDALPDEPIELAPYNSALEKMLINAAYSQHVATTVPEAIGDPGAYPTIMDTDGKPHEVGDYSWRTLDDVEAAVAADLLANGQQEDKPEQIEVTAEMLDAVTTGQFIEKALLTVANQFVLPEQGHLDAGEFYTVWFTKVLDNWTALVSTDAVTGLYWEVSYDGVQQKTHLDTFHKVSNVVVPDDLNDRGPSWDFSIEKAKILAASHFEVRPGDHLDPEDFIVSWSTLAEGHWKVVLISQHADENMWEVTYNSHTNEAYVDTYHEVESISIPDSL